MAAIIFEGVSKRFGATEIVPGLDLAIDSGAFVSLLGPSGCGKTTVLRMLAGLEQPTAGTIRIDGEVVNDLAPAARDVAMVFQSYALYPHMTVAENIAYPLRKRRVPKAERKRRVAEVSALLRLEPLLDRKPRQLSGGQQQRVALARALVREPRVFLLDEPLSNLDATLRAHMRAELIELHRRISRTMVYVTHDQLEAMTMSTYVAVIDGGRLQQYGTPRQVYEQPANRMVAGFIGTPAMSFLDAAVERDGANAVVRIAGVEIARASAPVAAGLVTLGIRAEDVAIGGEGLPATVRLVEPVGHETIVQLAVAGGNVAARAPAACALRPGESVRCRFAPDRLHLFDPAGGGRIDFAPAAAGITNLEQNRVYGQE